MKYCILTPTFRGHFKYLRNYLSSFSKKLEDKDNCVFYFIVNDDETREIERILINYPELCTRVVTFERILRKFNINISPDNLLNKYGKFSFQALKKFYGMLYLEDYRYFLVLDTESILFRRTSMSKAFKQFFFDNPFIIYSNVKSRLLSSESNLEASDNINFIFKSNCDKWFVEQYVRFWDVEILKDLFKEYGSCFDIVNNIYMKEMEFNPKLGLFESVLYDQFVFEHNNKYKYKLVDLDQECSQVFPADVLSKYREKMAKIWNGSCGLLESSSILLDDKNYKYFAEVFKKNNLNVIRVETEPDNYKWQKKFLSIVQPIILTCSQENLFEENKNLSNLFRILSLKAKHINSLRKQINCIKPWLKLAGKCLIFVPKMIANIIIGLYELGVNFVKVITPPPPHARTRA